MQKYEVGSIAYFVESNTFIREVQILKHYAGMYLIKFTDTKGAIQIKEHRLFGSEEAAQAELDKYKTECMPKTKAEHKNQYFYMH